MWTNIFKTDYKSELQAYKLVPWAELHMLIDFNTKTYIIMNVHIKQCGMKNLSLRNSLK